MICKYFFSFHRLSFHFLDGFVCSIEILIFIQSHLSTSSFVAFGRYLRKHCIIQTDSSKSLMVLALMSMICVCVCSVTQSCLTLCSPRGYSPSGSSAHEIFQARVLECGAISCSRGPSQPRI